MFPSFTLTSALLLLALALRTHAHAMPSPALGATAVPAQADGTVLLNITNYNAGGDGSRSVSVMVDPTGTGKKFVAAKMITNGDANPKGTGTEQVKVALPAGTQCTGGKAGNLCLLSVKSTAGFGGCTVASQLSSSPASSAAPPAKSAKPCKKSKRTGYGTRAPRALRRSLHENPVFANAY
ncbi:hypothetical protein DFH09DRAFT_1246772 [Mycena vulgaris]|nr:hypothetical protein DFH09DRAFT_1246772 [Mycena vulgaris]